MRVSRQTAAILEVVRTMPEPFDFRQVWAAIPSDQRPAEPLKVAQMLHRLCRSGHLVNTGRRAAGTPGKYKRSTRRKTRTSTTNLSPLERAWRELRATMTIPETAEMQSTK
jgi:hypothetical protein